MGELKNINSFNNFIKLTEYSFTNYEKISSLGRELVRLGIPSKLGMEYAEDFVATKSSREKLLDKIKTVNKQAYDYLYNLSDDLTYKGLLKGVDWED